MSDSFQPHRLQHTRLLCPPPSSGVCSESCPLSWWCCLTITSSVIPFSFGLLPFPSIRVFSSESVLHIRWPEYWSFNFSSSPSNNYPGLISFRIDLLAVQGTLKSLLQHHNSKASNSSALNLYGPTLTSIHDYCKNHSFDNIDLCQQSDVSAFLYAV